MHPRRRIAKSVGIAMLLVLSAGCAGKPHTAAGQLLAGLTDSGKVYVKSGDTVPTIVFEAGLGDGKRVWVDVAERLAGQYGIFAYDRPGYGGSPDTDSARDPCTIAEELRNQLRAAGVPPPYVLVGHSLGGLYQYVFARLHPEEVAGLLLLDPTHPDHWRRMQTDAPLHAATIKAARLLAFNSTMRREFDAQSVCLGTLDATRPLEIPARLLVSTRSLPAERGAFATMTGRLRQDWQRLTGAPGIEAVAGAGHYIQNDNPADVVDVIRELAAPDRRGSR